MRTTLNLVSTIAYLLNISKSGIYFSYILYPSFNEHHNISSSFPNPSKNDRGEIAGGMEEGFGTTGQIARG